MAANNPDQNVGPEPKNTSDRDQIRQSVDAANQYVDLFGKSPLNKVAGPLRERAVGYGVRAGNVFAEKTAGTALGKAATAAAGKVGGKLTGTAVGAAVGEMASPIGAAVGAAVGWVFDKTVGWINKHKTETAAILIGGAAGGLLTAGLPGIFIGMVAGGVIGITVGLYAASMASIIASSLIVFFAVPAFIAFCIFVINTGAWVVPPWGGRSDIPGTVDSIYINITKTPNPSSIANEELPREVTYTVTIEAERSVLTDIVIEYTCNVIREGSAPPCPQPNPGIPQPGSENYPSSISPGTPYIFTYTHQFTSEFQNSLVTDTILVTATAEGITGEQSSAIANVTIGTPPTGCFTFTTNWPAENQARVQNAIFTLLPAQGFMSQLCSQGIITLDFLPQVGSYGGWTRGYKDIVFYPRGSQSASGALYTLVHESGHVMAQVSGRYSEYLDTEGVLDEQPICTYPFSPHPDSEDFAEMIADYFVNNPRIGKSFGCLDAGEFDERYPIHWQFAFEKIYVGDRLGW